MRPPTVVTNFRNFNLPLPARADGFRREGMLALEPDDGGGSTKADGDGDDGGGTEADDDGDDGGGTEAGDHDVDYGHASDCDHDGGYDGAAPLRAPRGSFSPAHFHIGETGPKKSALFKESPRG